MILKFWKMNGAGNDFVMLDNRDLALQLTGQTIAQLCDRHRGVGADGVLLVEPAANGADFVLVGDFIWADPRGAAAALLDAEQAIRQAQTAMSGKVKAEQE